jgi:hypothetical protein
MVDQETAKWVVPNPQICRSFGLMNIIFGALLLLTGVGQAVMYVVSPKFQKQMMVNIKVQQAQRKAERETKLAELKSKENAAKTKDEKDAIKDEREALEKNVEPDLSSMEELTEFNVFSDIRVAIYSISELTAGMILNVLMIISGVGLMAMAEWARRLAITVAWLKILRWVAILVVTMFLILPINLEKSNKAFGKMEDQMGARSGARGLAVPMTALAFWGAIAGAVITVFSAVLASIYPALAIWFLTRPPARAACYKEAPPEEPQPAVQAGGTW